jgi:hypothetical protein
MSARCKRCGGPVDEPARCTNGHPQPTDAYERVAELLEEKIDYDRLAGLMAARLRAFASDLVAEVPEPGQLVDANTIARLTCMSPRWVYDHAQELGAIRAGDGVRPRLRFDPGLVRARLEQRNAPGPKPQAPTPASWRLPPAELLPVKGRAAGRFEGPRNMDGVGGGAYDDRHRQSGPRRRGNANRGP